MMRRKQQKEAEGAALATEREAYYARVTTDFEAAREAYVNGGSVEEWDAAFLDWAWIQPMTPLRRMILVLARTYSDATLERQKKAITIIGGAA